MDEVLTVFGPMLAGLLLFGSFFLFCLACFLAAVWVLWRIYVWFFGPPSEYSDPYDDDGYDDEDKITSDYDWYYKEATLKQRYEYDRKHGYRDD
jgi:hypothetical protein